MKAYLLHYNGIPITKADARAMQDLLKSGDKQRMKLYLMTHRPESQEEFKWYETLRRALSVEV